MWTIACAECPREGCSALTSSASEDGSRIAGIIASESDLVSDGCAECPFVEADVSVWSTDSVVNSTEQATAIMDTEQPTAERSADRRYEIPLEPGAYLVCVRPSCIGTVVGDGTVTVNIKRRNGPTSFFVEQQGKLVEDFGIDVGFGQ